MRVVSRALIVVQLAALLSACTPELVNETGVALPASDTPVPPGLADRCPPRKTPGRFPEGGQFPDGAVAVRLCNPDVLLDGRDLDARADVPVDVLDTRVEEFVAALNDLDQPVDPQQHFCPADGGPLMTWWVIYPGGEAWSAEYFTAGCREVQVDTGIPRPGGEETMTIFSDLLLDQRSHRTPAALDERPTCDGYAWTRLDRAERIGLADVVECEYRDGGLVVSLDLPRDEVDRIDSYARGDEMLPTDECRDKNRRTYRGLTTWGDLVQLYGACFPA